MTAALLAAAALTGAAQSANAQEKKLKDQGEYDIYNEVAKDIQNKNGAKAITDLDTWKQKYPDSDYKNDREVFYIQAYDMAKQPDKELEVANRLMSQGLDSLFPDPKTGWQQVVKVLFQATVAVQQIQNPTPEQLDIGKKAAQALLNYNKKPDSVSDADWATARKGMQDAANGALFRIAVIPAAKADAAKDCPAAEAAYSKALGDYPDKSLLSYGLARALQCQHKDIPALYEYARAVAIDPTLGGTQNAKTISDYVQRFYTTYHGGADGLDQLKEQAKQNPMPPPDLKIQSAQEVAEAKQKEFETTHPDIALWMKIKATLTSPQGPDYFNSGMKDAQTPELKGTVMESKCRARELLVAVPLPDATGQPTPEITLKLDTPLTGKAEQGQITFTGVAKEFTPNPFMLTMTADKKDIKDLKVTPCAAPAAKKGVTKKK
jgi:hypothetical protein